MKKYNEYCHHAKFAIYQIYSVRDNRNVERFPVYGHPAGRNNGDHFIDSEFSCESKMKEQKLTFITLTVCEKLATLKLLQHRETLPTGLTLIITQTYFFSFFSREPKII